MNKEKIIKKIMATMITTILILSISVQASAMSLYNKKSKSNSNYNQNILSIICGLINKTNEEETEKSTVQIPVSEDNTQTTEGVTVNTLSTEYINEMKAKIEYSETSDKLSIMDVIKFCYRIMKIYKNVDTGAQTITTSKQFAVLTSANSATEGTGPITVTPARLNNEEVTLMTLGGTEFLEGQATGIKEDILSGIEKSNDYLIDVINLFDLKDENGDYIIPQNKPIIISGISLGGMIAQQLLAQETLTSKYDFKYVICFGSPIIAPTYRNDSTTIVRFCDKNDIVPSLGVTSILDEISQKYTGSDPSEVITNLDAKEKILKDGGYKTFIGAHALSYVDNACWDGYDVLGVLNGGNKLTLETNMKFYDAPTLNK